MTVINYETKVTKEVLDIGLACKGLLSALGAAMADGKFDLATDIPAVIVTALANVGAAADGINLVGSEFSTHPALASNGLSAPVLEGIDEMMKGIRAGKISPVS